MDANRMEMITNRKISLTKEIESSIKEIQTYQNLFKRILREDETLPKIAMKKNNKVIIERNIAELTRSIEEKRKEVVLITKELADAEKENEYEYEYSYEYEEYEPVGEVEEPADELVQPEAGPAIPLVSGVDQAAEPVFDYKKGTTVDIPEWTTQDEISSLVVDETVTRLVASNCNLSSEMAQILLAKFPNLIHIDLTDNQIAELNLANNPHLERVHLANNRLNRINLGSLQLSHLDLTDNLFTNFALPEGARVNTLLLGLNRLKTFSLNSDSGIATLSLYSNQLKELTLSVPNIKTLEVSDNPLSTLTLVTGEESIDNLYIKNTFLGLRNLSRNIIERALGGNLNIHSNTIDLRGMHVNIAAQYVNEDREEQVAARNLGFMQRLLNFIMNLLGIPSRDERIPPVPREEVEHDLERHPPSQEINLGSSSRAQDFS